ncbi:MAG: hypothetical protein ACI4SR_07240 [Faecalibacillus sp.]
MFKYKDIRMLFISIALELACFASAIYFSHEKIKLIIALFLAVSLLPTLFIRFNAKIFDDSMIVYVFKGIAILPEIIEFQNVHEYQKQSKHKIMIKHKKTSNIYLVNADEFIKELDINYKKYKNYNVL